MRRPHLRYALFAAVCGFPFPALAQGGPVAPSPDRPRFWLWGPDGVPCGVTTDIEDDYQTAIVKIYADPNMTGALTIASATTTLISGESKIAA